MAIMNLLNLPLLFGSNALFPTSQMPDWLRASDQVNPVSYGTDIARQLILHTPNVTAVVNDFLFLGVFATVFASVIFGRGRPSSGPRSREFLRRGPP